LPTSSAQEKPGRHAGVGGGERALVQRLLMAGTWLNISLADDLAAILAREPADAVVIDCMLAGVLARSAEFATRWPGRTPPSG